MTAAAAVPARATDGRIAPVLILSTGRCGSTMISALLNKHPQVLSLSEFFVPLGPAAFTGARRDGAWMWDLFSRQSPALHAMLKDGEVVDEMLYPLGQPGARYRAADIPPIAMVTLPHLTDQPDALFDELAPIIRQRPAMPLAAQYQGLFDHLMARFGRRVWVERSGGSLMVAAKLLHLFPDARVIHVYRDGRDTAMSMAHHHNFRVLVGAMKASRRFGIDGFRPLHQPRGRMLDVWLQQLIFPRLNVRRLAGDVTLADLGDFWSRMILLGRQVFADLAPDRLLSLKFEDVQQSPHETLRRMIRFIDPSLDDAGWLDTVARIPKPARSKFTTLPPDTRAALTAACAPGLAALGYPLEG
ncbi:sulfotransferase [Tistrella bauzanensis]|uniref:sulfotransferase n=1 Tax=Tistrella TaxID=171436 RepID=UPI0031F61C98